MQAFNTTSEMDFSNLDLNWIKFLDFPLKICMFCSFQSSYKVVEGMVVQIEAKHDFLSRMGHAFNQFVKLFDIGPC